MQTNLWQALEQIPELFAAEDLWRDILGEDFEPFSPFLETVGSSLNGERVGVTGEFYHLNYPKFSRALCHAFGLIPKAAVFPLPATRQIGAWSADAVPVILT